MMNAEGKVMKKYLIVGFVLLMTFAMTITCFATKKYYAKFMPVDYSNWVWQEIPNVTSCTKTSDGLQYIIKYRGVPEPRIRQGKPFNNNNENEKTKERDLTMTIGVDNILIYEYEE